MLSDKPGVSQSWAASRPTLVTSLSAAAFRPSAGLSTGGGGEGRGALLPGGEGPWSGTAAGGVCGIAAGGVCFVAAGACVSSLPGACGIAAGADRVLSGARGSSTPSLQVEARTYHATNVPASLTAHAMGWRAPDTASRCARTVGSRGVHGRRCAHGPSRLGSLHWAASCKAARPSDSSATPHGSEKRMPPSPPPRARGAVIRRLHSVARCWCAVAVLEGVCSSFAALRLFLRPISRRAVASRMQAQRVRSCMVSRPC